MNLIFGVKIQMFVLAKKNTTLCKPDRLPPGLYLVAAVIIVQALNVCRHHESFTASH